MVWVLDNAVRLVELFGEVALTDPLSTALLAVGALLTGLAVGALGYLSAGAMVALVTPS